MARKKFENLNPEIRPRFHSLFKWIVVDRITGQRRKSPDTAYVPVVDSINFGTTERASVTWLGHATALISVGRQWVLTDPVFAESLGGLITRNVPVVLAPERLPPISTVVISHNHRDHLDKSSILAVEKHSRPQYIVPLGVEKILSSWRIPIKRITAKGWWDSTDLTESLKITCVPAQHWSRRGFSDLNTSWWCGYVIEGSNGTVYFAGDSGYFDQFKVIGSKFDGIDIALMPIGTYDPGWFMSPQHMNPEEALRALLDVGATRMMPIHWGTYKLSDEPLDEPPSRLKSRANANGLNAARIVIAAIGETITI